MNELFNFLFNYGDEIKVTLEVDGLHKISFKIKEKDKDDWT